MAHVRLGRVASRMVGRQGGQDHVQRWMILAVMAGMLIGRIGWYHAENSGIFVDLGPRNGIDCVAVGIEVQGVPGPFLSTTC